MKYPKIKAAVKNTDVVALVANMPLAITEAGFFLGAEQMDGIETALSVADTASAEVTRLTGELGTANTALQTATDTVADQKTKLDAKDARIAELEASGPNPKVHTFKTKDESANPDKNKNYMTSFDAMILN